MKFDLSNNLTHGISRAVNNCLKWLGPAFLLASFTFGQIASAALAQTVQEVRIRWDAYIQSSPPPQVSPDTIESNVLTLLERHSVSGQLPRQAYPRLSSDQIVVLARKGDGQIADLRIVPNPRVLGAELPCPSGELSGLVLHHVRTDLLIVLRDDPAIEAIELYHPRWIGTDYNLEIIGRVLLK
jgi:hypothetical protein